MSKVNSIPAINRPASIEGMAVQLSKHVYSAIALFEQIMMSDEAPIKDRLTAASKVIDFYLRVEKQKVDNVLAKQNQRLNALRINKEVMADKPAQVEPTNSLSFDVDPANVEFTQRYS